MHTTNPRPPVQFFFVEVTDTFSGEANYSWVARYKVKARCMRGAVRKVSSLRGYAGRLCQSAFYGDMLRHDVRGACICLFTEGWDDEGHAQYLDVKEI